MFVMEVVVWVAAIALGEIMSKRRISEMEIKNLNYRIVRGLTTAADVQLRIDYIEQVKNDVRLEVLR